MHTELLPLLLGNFMESNPGPVKFAMAAMGLCEEVFRLPMVPPRPASQERILAILKDLGLPVVAGERAGACRGRSIDRPTRQLGRDRVMNLQTTIEALFAAGAGADKAAARAAFAELRTAPQRRRRARRRSPTPRRPPVGASTPG